MSQYVESRPVYFQISDLELIRDRVRAGDARLVAAYTSLVDHADEILTKPITSVLDKTGLAASGNKQDFYAIGHYSWPNPGTPDGIPYIRRDGKPNREAYESDKFDKGRLQSLVDDVKILALAHFYSGHEKYAKKIAEYLRSWFIAPTTRMNPNLRYAAARPGVIDGLHSGIIEGVILIEMLDYVELLNAPSVWSADDVVGLKQWFLQFSDWLVESKFGRREIHSTNNHGSYYLAQVMAFAAYGENHRRAKSVIRYAKRQIDQQFASDGRMPREINRSNALFYSVYGLRAFVVLAKLAERYDEDFWSYCIAGQDTPAIANSFYFLSPFLSGVKEWNGPRLDMGFTPYAIQICRIAGSVYKSKTLNDMVEYLVRQPSAVTVYDSLIGLSQTSVTSDGEALFEKVSKAKFVKVKDSSGSRVMRKFAKAMAIAGLWPNSRLH